MDGAELSARFALPPNSRSYCGIKPFSRIFASYLKNRSTSNLRALQAALSSFHAHYAYLKLIAAANGRRPFDAKVAEALWLGNGLLSKVERKDLQRLMLKDFCGKGMLSRERARRLASSLQGGFVAHHSFHTLYIHSITGVVPPTVKTSDNCRVSWGKAVRLEKDAVIVSSQKLVKEDGILKLIPCKKKWKTSCAGIALLPDIRKGDNVAAHWGVAVTKITGKQMEGLERATERNVAAANDMQMLFIPLAGKRER